MREKITLTPAQPPVICHTASIVNRQPQAGIDPPPIGAEGSDTAATKPGTLPTYDTVLVVDDNPINLKVLYNILLTGGYKAIPAQDAHSALARIETTVPDLILLDIMMPGINGFELYERMRNRPQIADTPIMFVSALSDVETIEQGFALGAVDYITKPFRAVEILGRVGAHLRLRSLQASLTATNAQLQTLLHRQQCILNGVGEGIFGVNANGKLSFINPRALELLGYTQAEVTGLNIHAAVHHTAPGGQQHPVQNCPILEIARHGKGLINGIDQFYHRSGKSFPVEFTVSGLADPHNEPTAIVLFRDITDRLKVERRLQEAAAVFEVSSEGIFLTDAQGTIQRVNPAFSEVTGYQPHEVIGNNAKILQSGRHNQSFYAEMWHQFTTKGSWEGEIWNRRKDGSVYPQWEMIRGIRDDHNHIVGYAAQFSDITRRKLTEDELRYRGNYDVLTGLANRSLMVERMEQSIKEHRRRERKLGIMFMDLDLFKQVNDSLGHHMGDLLLQQVATRIHAVLREIDTAARLGGDEFVILLTDITNIDPVEQIAERLLATLGQSFELNGAVASISTSIGIAMFPDDGITVEVLLQHADSAMYWAKNCGRNRACFFNKIDYSQDSHEATRRITL